MGKASRKGSAKDAGGQLPPPPLPATRPSRRERDFAAARANRTEDNDPRPRILSAAAMLFAERGFSAASIDQVAERLGATKGLVYHHYRSKSELFVDVCDEALQELERAVLPHFKSGGHAITELRGMAEAHVGDVLARIAFHKTIAEAVSGNLDGALRPSDRDLLMRIAAKRESYDGHFAETIAQASAERDLPSGRDTQMLGRIFVSVLDGPVRWPPSLVADMAPRFALVARQLAYFALRGAGASDYTLSQEFAR